MQKQDCSGNWKVPGMWKSLVTIILGKVMTLLSPELGPSLK